MVIISSIGSLSSINIMTACVQATHTRMQEWRMMDGQRVVLLVRFLIVVGPLLTSEERVFMAMLFF